MSAPYFFPLLFAPCLGRVFSACCYSLFAPLTSRDLISRRERRASCTFGTLVIVERRARYLRLFSFLLSWSMCRLAPAPSTFVHGARAPAAVVIFLRQAASGSAALHCFLVFDGPLFLSLVTETVVSCDRRAWMLLPSFGALLRLPFPVGEGEG
ncbi:hypothetical protein DFH06DRAFT_1184708 [Mycena polygramma]|nr:hypothetical protein DFH06DRAFT_1184708 [Mycena polygramma]